MEKIIFECETITPMFLAGADGVTPELRAPSIKGALRFWWRAMNGHLKLDNLRNQESEIFGGTNPARRSAVSIKVKSHDRIEPFRLPRQDRNPGLAYLWYSNYLNNREGFHVRNFRIEFQSNNLNLLLQATDAFWLLQTFGAIGTRSRRCAGNFTVNSVSKTITDEIIFDPRTNDNMSYEQFLNDRLSSLSSRYKIEKSVTTTNFPVLASSMQYIVNTEFSDPLKAVEYIGSEFQQFRSRYQPDYSTVKQYIQNGDINSPVEKAAFGLPLSYRYRSLEGKGAQINTGDKDQNRSASSLILKIGYYHNHYYPIITNFNSDLFFSDDSIEISSREQKNVNISKPNSQIKNAFINQLSNVIELS